MHRFNARALPPSASVVQMGATVRVVVGAVVVGALTLGGHAHATEPLLPLKAPPLAASNFDWNGFYVGGHMGYAWGRSGWTGETPDTPLLGGSLGFYQPWNG